MGEKPGNRGMPRIPRDGFPKAVEFLPLIFANITKLYNFVPLKNRTMKFEQRLSRSFSILTLSFFTLCAGVAQADEVRRHTVRPGDTYYSLARYYHVTVDALKAANPEQGRTLISGTQIVIPDAIVEEPTTESTAIAPSTTSVVKPTVASSLPTAVDTTPSTSLNALSSVPHVTWPYSLHADYRISLVLPFRLENTAESDKQRARNVELYQGFLMALDTLQKTTQARFELNVYDASAGLTSLLGGEELSNSDLIISTVEKTEAQQIAAFAEQRAIPFVTPFVYNAAWHNRYPHTYQINTPKAQTYETVTNEVLHRFQSFTPIFLVDSIELGKSEEYANYLRATYDRQGIEYYIYGYSDPADVSSLDSALQISGDRLYIPITASRNALRRMFPYLQYLRSQIEEDQFAVLGAPEWQLYVEDFIEYYYNLDVYIYSKIYVNPFADDVRDFYTAFKRWYGCDPMPLYPKYALMGYDLGLYYLSALTRYGRSFAPYLSSLEVPTLQSALTLRSEGKGMINKGVYLIHFTPQTTIEKYDLR